MEKITVETALEQIAQSIEKTNGPFVHRFSRNGVDSLVFQVDTSEFEYIEMAKKPGLDPEFFASR